MRLLSAFFLICLMATPLYATSGCAGNKRVDYTPIAQRYQNGLLFKVGLCGKPSNYIFGTVHSDDPELENIAARAIRILQMSSAAGFEYLDPDNADEISKRYMFLDGDRTLSDLIGSAPFKKISRALQKQGIPARNIMHLKPWAAAVMLQYPASVADGVTLDNRLQQIAASEGIELFGLETLESQLQIFDSLSTAMQLQLVNETLHSLDEIDEKNEKLLQAYKRGSLTEITALSETTFDELEEEALRDFFRKKLLRDRNRHMAGRLQKEFRNGRRFVAVGALHLPGDDGILTLLENKGYLIQAVP